MVIDIKPGHIFKYAEAAGDGSQTQERFLRLWVPAGIGPNAVNLATFVAVSLDWDREVTDLGELGRRPPIGGDY